MTEQTLAFPLGDGKRAYGRLKEISPTAPLVVLVHGLSGHMNEHLHFEATRYLTSHGFSVFRFNLYGPEPDARRLTECTVSTHAHDVDAVLALLRERVPARQVALVGHSLGGLTALMVQTTVDALVLWDASHTSSLDFLRAVSYVAGLGLYRWRQRLDLLINPAMIDELHQLDSDDLVAGFASPVLIIAADEAGRPDAARRYYDHGRDPKELVIVPGADHTFTIEGTLDHALDTMGRWLTEQLVLHKSP